MAGGVVWCIKVLIGTDGAPSWPAEGTDHLFVIEQLLFLVGLAGLYASCKDSLEGAEGGVAFAVSSVGVMVSCVGHVGLLSTEVAWSVFALGCVVEFIGLMAFSAAAAQGKTLPYWSPLPFVIGLLGFFSFPIGNPPNSDLEIYITVALRMLFGLGWVLLGYHLFSGRGKDAWQHA